MIFILNLLLGIIQWNYKMEIVNFYENLFLINYLFDGLIRINLVGKDILLYPSVIIFDLLFPLIIYTLFVSELQLANRLLWSTFLFLRFIHPDRYLRFNFLRKCNVVIRTIVNSFFYQIYLCAILGFIILIFSKIGLILFRHLNYNLLIYEPNQMPYYYSSFFYSFIHLSSTAFTDSYDFATILMRIRNEYCLKTDPYHRYYLLAESQIVNVIDRKLNLDALDRGEFVSNGTLFSCFVRYDLNAFNLIIDYDESQIDHLMQLILKTCIKDGKIDKSNLLTCKFDTNFFSKKIKYIHSFEDRLNLALKQISELNSNINTNLTYEIFKNRTDDQVPYLNDTFTISDQYFTFLNDLCVSYNSSERVTISQLDDKYRLFGFSTISNLIYLHFLNVFKLIMNEQFNKKLSLNRICSEPKTIQLFYLIFFIICKFFILNILKTILFKRYDLERLRNQSDFFNSDIQDFINSWRSFEQVHDDKNSSIQDYMSIDLILIFIQNNCPAKFRIENQTDETCLYILSKYSAKLNCFFNKENANDLIKMRMHLFDVLSICVAIHFNSSPTVFFINYPFIIKNLNVYILRTFPTFILNQSNLISLEATINQHYLTKLLILKFLETKLLCKNKKE